jgi:hypothetical protein
MQTPIDDPPATTGDDPPPGTTGPFPGMLGEEPVAGTPHLDFDELVEQRRPAGRPPED